MYNIFQLIYDVVLAYGTYANKSVIWYMSNKGLMILFLATKMGSDKAIYFSSATDIQCDITAFLSSP